MIRLVYLSPVPWSSFSQRPHKFVEWFHAQSGGDVVWVEPYPTRLPNIGDFRRLRLGSHEGKSIAQQGEPPAWLKLVRPRALPVEPLPLLAWANVTLWRNALHAIESFAKEGDTFLAIGKPSLLALLLLSKRWFKGSVYDSMDHFSAFYSGVSRFVMSRREAAVVAKAQMVLASSTCLLDQWRLIRNDVSLVRNACDPAVLPAPRAPLSQHGSRRVFGYIGTIGRWFDWDAVAALARAQPQATVRVIGPVFVPVPAGLPGNVEMLPPCTHEKAMDAVTEFDVGLIPFKRSELTDSVDPIKYYEYRALGIPVISTRFGEMRQREGERGVFLANTADEMAKAAAVALDFRDSPGAAMAFRGEQTWFRRFQQSPVGRLLIDGGVL